MPNTIATKPCLTRLRQASALAAVTPGNGIENNTEGVATERPLTAVFSPTEAPNKGISSHSLAIANAKRRVLIQGGADLKQRWLDQELWRALAASRHYRLPHWYLPLTPRGIENVLRELGLGKQEFSAHFGHLTYKQFASMNPKMPLWAFAGQCLELSQPSITSRTGPLEHSENPPVLSSSRGAIGI